MSNTNPTQEDIDAAFMYLRKHLTALSVLAILFGGVSLIAPRIYDYPTWYEIVFSVALVVAGFAYLIWS